MTFQKGHKFYKGGEKTQFKKEQSPWNKGKTKTEFPQLSNSGVKKGNIPWCKGKKLTKEHKINLGLAKKGKPSPHKNRIIKICLECKKEFETIPCKKETHKYCSSKCRCLAMGKLIGGKLHYNWQGGISFEPYGLEFNKKLKEQIRKRDGYICQECKFPQRRLKRKLDIHHIDYNKKNNNPENLISLCSSCHIQTNFKREDWNLYFKEKQNSNAGYLTLLGDTK